MFTDKNFKWLVSMTFAIPILSALIFLYVTGNKGVQEILEAPKIEIVGEDKDYDYIIDDKNYINYVKETDEITFEADKILYNKTTIEGKVTINNPHFFKLGKNYYTFFVNEEDEVVFEKFNEYKLIKDNLVKKSISLGLNFIVGLGVAAFAFYIISKKMNFVKKHRRLTTLIFLSMITILTLVLNLIIRNFFLIFLSITIAFGLYYIEWIIMRKKKGLPLSDQIIEQTKIIKEDD